MEIKDYLKVLGKRAWLLVMIPAVAGVVAGLIAVRQPQAFRTTATLQLPHDKEASPAEVAQLVADFRATINNPTIQNGVAEDTGVPVKRIKRIKVTQVGDSSQLTLGIQDKRRNPTDSKAVIQGLTNGALGFMEAPEVRAAESALDAANGEVETAQSDLDDANRELSAILSEIRSAAPEDDLRVLRTEASAATQAMFRYQAEGNPAGAEIHRAYRDEVLGRIATLQDALPRIHVLQAQAATATTALTEAQTEREAALDQVGTASTEPDLTFSAEGQAVVRKTRVVKTAAAAVVAGLPIAVGVVLLLDAMQKRRQNRPARPAYTELDDELDEDYVVADAPAVAPALVGASAASATGQQPGGLADANGDLDEGDDLDDLDELDDELDDLDEDVAATVASRRRQYDADIDDDLSVDGGPDDGNVREWARVPAADEDFDGDDEAGADR